MLGGQAKLAGVARVRTITLRIVPLQPDQKKRTMLIAVLTVPMIRDTKSTMKAVRLGVVGGELPRLKRHGEGLLCVVAIAPNAIEISPG